MVTINEDLIGKWVRRSRRRTRWHLVQSIINDEVLTKCGRYMSRYTIDRGELETVNYRNEVYRPCTMCDREDS